MYLAQETAKLSLRSVYTALDTKKRQIRVIDVEAAGDDAASQIRANLVHLSLDEHPQYETVSYAWGDATQRSEILLDGSTFPVPTSAAQALRQLRYADRTRRLWIDSICINQADNQERSQQVAMMGDIYSQTWRNLVWLGEYADPDFERNVVLNLKIAMDDMRRQTDDLRNIHPTLLDSNGRQLYSTSGIADLRSEPLYRLYSLDWFTRLWVMQEVVLAPESICHLGSTTFPLDDVLHSALWLHHKQVFLHVSEETALSFLRVFSMAYMNGRRPKGWYCANYGRADVLTLSTLIVFTQRLRVSDPRDRIYGLLGLVGLDGNLQLQKPCPIVPSYGNSTQKIYRDAMIILLAESGLEKLRDVGCRNEADFDDTSPSWIPRWDMPFDLAHDAEPMGIFFQPDKGTSLSQMKASTTKTVLSSFGVSLGEIVVSSQVIQPVYIKDGRALLKTVNDFKSSLSGRFLAYENTEHALRWTLIAGTNCDSFPAENRDANDLQCFEQYVNTHGRSPGVGESGDIEGTSDENWGNGSRFYAAVWHMARHRRLFYTQAGYIGLGPGILKPGDRVYILGGLNWPAILRPQDTEALRFRYVGHSYVAEMMYGEIVQRFGGDWQVSKAMQCLSIV